MRDINSSHNQLQDYLDTEKQVEQVMRGGCFRSICFFLLDEQQVAYEASCTTARAGEVIYLTQSEGKQEAMRQL